MAEWYLTLPVNPTNENLEWLEGFTAGHGLLAQWRGLNFLEGLAADYPSVIDYYLRDGKDRLQAALESLTTVLRTSMRIGPAAARLRPAGSGGSRCSRPRQCGPSRRCTRAERARSPLRL